jgi:TolB-like protein/tetratricopeptide (TPR) repeat protein
VFRVGIAYVIAAWLIMQVADVLIDNIGAPDWVFPTLLMALGIGFLLALIFAWAFELTPEGLKRESEVNRETSIAPQTGRKLDRAIIVVLALGIGYLLVDKLILQPQRIPEPSIEITTEQPADTPVAEGPSVAVLPFTNMSNDPDNEYFSDGLTETLLHMLAQLPDLRVAARTSSFAFKGQNRSISEIAGELGVANILEGSVQRAGDQVRVTAQLIRAEDGFHIWSQNYTRPLQDIFAIQDEIATDVASALGASLLSDGADSVRGVATTDLTAYDRYLKGLEQQAISTYGSLDEAQNDFEQALAEDPAFTDARLALVRNYMRKRLTGMIDNRELNRAAMPLVRQALESQPDNKLAQAYESMLQGRFTDEVKSKAEVREAIYRNRNLLAYVPTDSFMRTSVAGGLHFVLDEPETALDLLDAGLLIDPLDADLYVERGRILLDQERLDEAETALLKAIELAPTSPSAASLLGDVYASRGDFAAYLDWLHKSMLLDPQDHELPHEIATNLYALGLTEEAEPLYARVQTLAPGSPMARILEVIRADLRGEVEQSIELSQRMIEDQVDNRRGSFWLANFYYADNMMRAGRSQEAYDFLVELRPEVENWDGESPDFNLVIMKRFAILLMSGFATFEERQDAWNRYVEAAEAQAFPVVEKGNAADIIDALINGDIERAVTTHLEYRMSESVAEAPWRHRSTLEALYQPLYSDPRYIAALGERNRQVTQSREAVQELLLTPEWSE